MKQVTVALENCYGIKKLDYKFDFSAESVYAIYAPNGSMKSSLAQTFKDVAEKAVSKDRIFPVRVSVRKITDENGADLPSESVLVLTGTSVVGVGFARPHVHGMVLWRSDHGGVSKG